MQLRALMFITCAAFKPMIALQLWDLPCRGRVTLDSAHSSSFHRKVQPHSRAEKSLAMHLKGENTISNPEKTKRIKLLNREYPLEILKWHSRPRLFLVHLDLKIHIWHSIKNGHSSPAKVHRPAQLYMFTVKLWYKPWEKENGQEKYPGKWVVG